GQRATLAEVFRQHGYSTGAVAGNPYLYSGTGFERGYETYEFPRQEFDWCRTILGALARRLPSVTTRGCRTPAPQVSAAALRTLRAAQPPFFLTLNYMDAHDPYYAPDTCRSSRYRPQSLTSISNLDQRVNDGNVPLAPMLRQELLSDYQDAIRCMDHSLGDLFAMLGQLPGADHTIIAVVGDHGEQFGEHNIMGHGNSLYSQVLHVPMLLVGPGIPVGHVSEPISTVALHDILLRLSGLEAGQWNFFSAFSAPVLSIYRPPHGSLRVFASRFVHTQWSVIMDHYQLIDSDDGREEMYDFRADPEEKHDLAGDPAVLAIRLRLIAALPTEAHHQPGPDNEEMLRSLGYLQ
ncbi:MAG: sulfatase-like hydrolase/transferase, partial [Terriglobales bacterium]